MVSVEYVNANTLEKAEALLEAAPRKLNTAIRAAEKRAGQSGRAMAKKSVSQAYFIKQKQFLSHTDIKQTSSRGSNPTIMNLIYRGRRIEAGEFNVSRKDNYYSFKYARSDPGTVMKKAFTHGGPYKERVGKKRYPIRKIWGPPGPVMVDDVTVQPKVDEKIAETFQQRLDHEVSRLLTGG